MRLIFTALACAFLIPCFASAERPNFVLFIADDVSQEDVGCYGNPHIQTPNIDALAGAGLRFDNAYLITSSCSPSRCSIITGRYPHNTGAPELHTELPAGSVLFPERLKDDGYYTVLSGKHHMGPNANAAFSQISKGKGVGKEEDWVELLRDRPKDQPFFCWFASTDAHRPWGVTEHTPSYSLDDVRVPPYLFDGPQTREDLASYYHEVSRFDFFIGQVVAELRRQEVFDNTYVIVMADNGRPFPRCKTRLYDSGIKTPFVIHDPTRSEPATVDGLISSIDVSATILDLANVEIDERIQGVSFRPILDDTKEVTREVVFAEHNWHVFRNHERLVRFGDWLYIRNHYPEQQNLCVEAYQGGAGVELWDAYRNGKLNSDQMPLFLQSCPEEELYHVSKDADQLQNLADNPEQQSVLERARKALREWTEQTGDTVPSNPTPDRNTRPSLTQKEGEPTQANSKKSNRRTFQHLEMPGDAAKATAIHHPGPLRLP